MHRSHIMEGINGEDQPKNAKIHTKRHARPGPTRRLHEEATDPNPPRLFVGGEKSCYMETQYRIEQEKKRIFCEEWKGIRESINNIFDGKKK